MTRGKNTFNFFMGVDDITVDYYRAKTGRKNPAGFMRQILTRAMIDDMKHDAQPTRPGPIIIEDDEEEVDKEQEALLLLQNELGATHQPEPELPTRYRWERLVGRLEYRFNVKLLEAIQAFIAAHGSETAALDYLEDQVRNRGMTNPAAYLMVWWKRERGSSA